MKVVIAAAGRGTRFKALTVNQPKVLIPILGKPFLYYVLNQAQAAGFSEIILVTGYQAEKVAQFLKDYDFKVTVVNQFEILGQEKYGTACLMACVKPLIGSENFVLFHGDNLYSVRDLKAIQIEDDFNYAAGLKHPRPEAYGALIKDADGFLTKIVEKPQNFVSDLINLALYKFTPEIFSAASQVKISARGEYELTEAISDLAGQRKVKVVALKDYWLDLGRPEDLPLVENFIKYNLSSKNSPSPCLAGRQADEERPARQYQAWQAGG